MDPHYISLSGKGLYTICWHSMSSGPVRWAVELVQCIKQLILLQPTAVGSAAVLLMGTDKLHLALMYLCLLMAVDLNCPLSVAGAGEDLGPAG